MRIPAEDPSRLYTPAKGSCAPGGEMREGHTSIIRRDKCGMSCSQKSEMSDGNVGHMAIDSILMNLTFLEGRYTQEGTSCSCGVPSEDIPIGMTSGNSGVVCRHGD